MELLTDRQQKVLNFITSYFDIHSCPPTLREISGHIGTKGTATALLHVEALERKGYIQRREGSSRSISLAGRSGTVSVPIVGSVHAGSPTLAIENIYRYYSVDASWVSGQNCFFLRVEGNSMIEAGIQDGDLALIRPQRTADNGQIVVAKVGDEATLKRFYHEGDRIRLQPENPTMEPIIINEGDAETVIIGKLLKTIRDYQ